MPRNPGVSAEPPKPPSMGEHSGSRIGELNGGTPRPVGGPRGALSGGGAGSNNSGASIGQGNPYKIGPTAPDVRDEQRGGRGTRFYDAYTIKVDGIPGPQTFSAAGYNKGDVNKSLGGNLSGNTGGRYFQQGGAAGLRPGSTGPNVGAWQNQLKSMGFYKGKVDNNFGPMTFNATRNFQKSYNANVAKDYYALPKPALPGQIVSGY